MLDLLLNYHKRKLESIIEHNCSYDKILKQSQKIDLYINKKMKRAKLALYLFLFDIFIENN